MFIRLPKCLQTEAIYLQATDVFLPVQFLTIQSIWIPAAAEWQHRPGHRESTDYQLVWPNIWVKDQHAGWKSAITEARRKGDRYFLIKRKVNYETLKKLKELPIFSEGQYKGGMVAQAENRRILPNSDLAARTIGYLNLGNEGNEVGIEGAFDKELAGKNGVAVKQRLTGGDWIIVDGPNSVDSRDGNDVVTTLDLDLQDVATTALLNQLKKNDADHGCAVLMEVSTGKIKAIANLGLQDDGQYHETYNYAIGESTEPGSTFKLPSLMAALEDGVIDTGDIVDTGTGTVKYYNKIIRDTKRNMEYLL